MPPTEHYHIPGAWDPTASLLGRGLKQLDPDELRAEATFYVAAVATVAGYLVLVFLGWAWINWDGPPAEVEVSRYWMLQSLGLVAVVALAWVGRQRGVEVVLTDEGIRIEQGSAASLQIPYSEIDHGERIPNIRFHQHYRLYAETRAFRGRVPEKMVLLKTTAFPVVLGIRPAEQALFLERVLGQVEAKRRETHRVA